MSASISFLRVGRMKYSGIGATIERVGTTVLFALFIDGFKIGLSIPAVPSIFSGALKARTI